MYHNNTLRRSGVRSNMQFVSKLLKEYVKELILEESSVKRLRVFDFDDTLVKTDAKVWVTNNDEVFPLTPGEFAVYEPEPGDKFDYTEFGMLINPRVIHWTVKILTNVYSKYGPNGLVILTARDSSSPVEQFLNDAGFSGIQIVALGSSDPMKKAGWIDQKIRADDLELVEFFDDSHKNIHAVNKPLHQFRVHLHCIVSAV